MTRLRAVLAAAVALVLASGGALLLRNAIDQARLDYGMTCDELRALVGQVRSETPEPAFVALASGYAPPVGTADGHALGECTATECVIESEQCGVSYSYQVIRGALVAGWRVWSTNAPKYFRAGWRQLAYEDGGVNVKFFRGINEVGAACLATGMSAANCRSLLTGAGIVWRRAGGYQCRNGLLYGPGLGGVDAAGNLVTCTPQAGDTPALASVVSGQDPEAMPAYNDGEP